MGRQTTTSYRRSIVASHRALTLNRPCFETARIDISFDEDTPDTALQAKVEASERLNGSDKAKIGATLIGLHANELAVFIAALEAVLSRTVKSSSIMALHGERHTIASVADALSYFNSYAEGAIPYPFVRYEIVINYTNGNEIKGQFNDKIEAVKFLRCLR